MQSTKANRIVAYRKGSLDAFIATFIYWKLFKSSIGQTYAAVDPFDRTFIDNMTRNTNLDFVISIGANIKGGSTSRNELGFNESKGIPPSVRFESFEVNESFPDVESFENWSFHKDTSSSLTQLVLRQLEKDGYLTADSQEFRLMNQFFRFSSTPRWVIDPQVADELALLIPNMLPSDFETLDAMLFSPTAALLKLNKRSTTEMVIEQTEAGFASDWMKACSFDDTGDSHLLMTINSSRYTHPSAAKHFQKKNAYVFVYEQLRDGVRGKLFAPEGGNALTRFPSGIRSGNETEADYFIRDFFMVSASGVKAA